MDDLTTKAQEESLEKQMEILDEANKEQNKEALEENAAQASENAISIGTAPNESQEDESQREAEIEEAVGVEKTETKQNEISQDQEKEITDLSREDLVNRLEDIYKNGIVAASKTLVALLRVTYKDKTEDWKRSLREKFEAESEQKEGAEATQDKNMRISDALEERFSEVSRKIKELHVLEREEREKLMTANLEKKKALLEDLRQLIDLDQPLKQTYDAFNKLTEVWKEIKPIAREEANNLWETYHFLVEKFFDKIKMNNELRTLDQKKNLEKKLQLCEKAEALLLEESTLKASQHLHEFHKRWKEIGQVSMEMKDEIWERFKAASDKISQRRKVYYEELDAKLQQNLLAKTELCEKMAALLEKKPTDAKTWNDATKEVEECMNLWKSIGRAPEKDNDVIWEKFKGSMHVFFEDKKNFYQQLRDEQTQNYNLKIDLCVQAENISAQRVDWKVATQDILKIQKQWKEIGPVPYRLSDKIWKRFRAACDSFFDKKAAQYEQMKSNEGQNLELKQGLIDSVKQLACETREELVQAIQDIQRKWSEIGFVPMKEKERLYSEFRQVIDNKFGDKNIKGVERRGIGGIVSSIETVDDAARLSGKEVQLIVKKIAQLKADMQIWENNIGFLSQSKNSEVLRVEVDKKMQKAKQEIALFEAKLKLIQKKGA